ncbi:MAG: hypothetical protein Q8M40_10040 [Legionella sp.]|nr:hypothetical protein [Legionella sp.]
MNIKLLAIGLSLSINAFADGYYPEPTSQDQPWSVTASVGNGRYAHLDSSDKTSALARLALGNELMLAGEFALGVELGVQNGTRIRLKIPEKTRAVLGWLPVRTTLGPMLDLLITAKSDPLAGSAFFAQLKGGVAYRHWKTKELTINNLSQIAGEIQAGFGYPITALASLNLLYQGVYGSNPDFQVSSVTKSAHVANIPSLHAILLGFSVNI